jgi:hypothetical protein
LILYSLFFLCHIRYFLLIFIQTFTHLGIIAAKVLLFFDSCNTYVFFYAISNKILVLEK